VTFAEKAVRVSKPIGSALPRIGRLLGADSVRSFPARHACSSASSGASSMSHECGRAPRHGGSGSPGQSFAAKARPGVVLRGPANRNTRARRLDGSDDQVPSLQAFEAARSIPSRR
jgi:hypothetical protein